MWEQHTFTNYESFPWDHKKTTHHLYEQDNSVSEGTDSCKTGVRFLSEVGVSSFLSMSSPTASQLVAGARGIGA
jgi:hypothetical protein